MPSNRRRTSRRFAIAQVLLVCACGGASPTDPSASGASGRIADLQAARDIIIYNQRATAGMSHRRFGLICRWQTPVPVYVAPPLRVEDVTAALEHWRARAGIDFQIVTDDREPRILVRAGEDGIGSALARGGVDGTYPDNRARSGLIVIGAAAGCLTSDCSRVYRHELGHALGFFDHGPATGLMGATGGAGAATDREAAMMRELYKLPFGATVQSDGSWRVGGVVDAAA